MLKKINFIFILSVLFTVSKGQIQEELLTVAKRALKPEFNYQYNLYSKFASQTIKERKTPAFNVINAEDTLTLKSQLINDTSDASLCFKLYNTYKALNKLKTARFYLNKSIYWYEEKIKSLPDDSASAMNLAVLYSANDDFENAARAYKLLYNNVSDKEMPAMMLSILYMSRPDSVDYFLKRYDKYTKDDYKKMLLISTINSFRFMYNYEEKDSTLYKNKHYKELTDWARVEKIYQKKKDAPEYELIYQSIRTYLIILQSSIVDIELIKKYKDELAELEGFYLKCISSKKYPNKIIPYLSLSAIYTTQKNYEQALSFHQKAYEFSKKYEITDSKESEEIINSYIGLLDKSKKYKEGITFTDELMNTNKYNAHYFKSFVYFCYQSNSSGQISPKLVRYTNTNPDDLYPHLVKAYESISIENYDTAVDELKKAYFKNPAAPETYALMAVMHIAKGKFQEAEITIKNFERQLPELAEKLRLFIN